MSSLIRKGTYTVEQILPLIPRKKVLLGGDIVTLQSQTLILFKKMGTTCVRCGIKGIYFAKEKMNLNANYSMRLYALNAKDEEVLMTKDHIVPKSKGGSNTYTNYQVMCVTCNKIKNTDDHYAKTSLIEKLNLPHVSAKELINQWGVLGQRRRMTAWVEGASDIIIGRIEEEDSEEKQYVMQSVMGWENELAKLKEEVFSFIERNKSTFELDHASFAAWANEHIENHVLRKVIFKLKRDSYSCTEQFWREALYRLTYG